MTMQDDTNAEYETEDQDAEATETESAPVAPTTGGPQVYRLEQEGGTVHGQAVEKGGTVTLLPEEAQRLAAGGVQLSWNQADQEPEEEEGEEEETEPEA